MKLKLSLSIFFLSTLILFSTNATAPEYKCEEGIVCTTILDCIGEAPVSAKRYCDGDKVIEVRCRCSGSGSGICKEREPEVVKNCLEIVGFNCQNISEDFAACLGDSLKDEQGNPKSCTNDKDCLPKDEESLYGNICKDEVAVRYTWVCFEGVCRQEAVDSQDCSETVFDIFSKICIIPQPPPFGGGMRCHCAWGKCVVGTVLTGTDRPQAPGGPVGIAFPLTLNGNLLIGVAGLLVLVSLITSFL